jgi:CRP-like cAMP-binding protein
MADPAEPFEAWLRRRVAEAVESAEVSADRLTELHAAIAEARARPPEAREALALMDLAERVNIPADHLTELLATLEAQPTVTRERILRRFVEEWLM